MVASNRIFFNFISENVDKYSRADSLEGQRAVLVELEETLRLLNSVDYVGAADDVSATRGIVWALNPENSAWAAAGLDAEQRTTWEAFRQSPTVAGAWTKLGVSAGLASFMHANNVNFPLYETWMKFYNVDASTPESERKEFLGEVLDFLKEPSVTPAQSSKWVAAGVRLRDVPVWKNRGFTPATAKKELESGVEVGGLGEESPIPGTTYPKIAKMAEQYGWVVKHDEQTRNRWRHCVKLETPGSTATVSFSPTGRLSYFECNGGAAQKMNELSGRPFVGVFFGGRGIRLLEQALEVGMTSTNADTSKVA